MASDIDTVTVPPSIAVQRSDQRYFGNHGWLQSYHSFSFADYYDPHNIAWGALRVLNDDRVSAGQGFGAHSHADMEIISYVLEGRLEHRDSLGNHGIVEPGGVQFMSAGTGVRHSEFNASPTEELHFLQMWVTPRNNGVAPSYGQHNFKRGDRLNRWLDIASGVGATPAPIQLDRDAIFSVARVEDTTIQRSISFERLGFLFVAEGNVTVRSRAGGRETNDDLNAGDALRIAGEHALEFTGKAELVLWDIPPLLA